MGAYNFLLGNGVSEPSADIWLLAKQVTDDHLFFKKSVLSTILFEKIKVKWSSCFCIGKLLWWSHDAAQYTKLDQTTQVFNYLMFETRILPEASATP